MISLLRNRNFTLILSGKLVSLVGSSIYYISLIWYVLSISGSENGKLLTWVMVLGLLPAVLLGGIIGGFVDRYNKKHIIVFSDIISGAVVLVVTYLMARDRLHPIYLLLATSMLSITTTALSISVRSIIPELLKDQELQMANSSNQFIERLTGLLGLLFGGILVSLFGVQMVFLLNGLSFLISAFFETFIQYQHNIKSIISPNDDKPSFKNDFLEISYYLLKNKNILTLLFVFTFVNLLWDPLFMIVMPYTLKNDFTITPTQFGAIEAALGVGFCLSAIYFIKKPKFVENNGVLFYSILSANTLIFLFSIPIMFHTRFAQSSMVFVYFFFLLVFCGFFSAALNIAVATLLQKIIPEHLRGKFYGVSTSISQGLIPLSGVIMGSFIGKIDSYLFFIVSCFLVYAILIFVPAVSYLTRHLYEIRYDQTHSQLFE